MKTPIPNDSLTLPDGKVTSYSDLLLIDESDISSEFSRHAAWLGYIGVLTAESEAIYENAKLDAEMLYAETDATIRLELATKGVKFTEAMVSSRIMLDDAYLVALKDKISNLETYKKVRALETAMKEKGQMLISLGATMRQEMDVTTLVSRIKRD